MTEPSTAEQAPATSEKTETPATENVAGKKVVEDNIEPGMFEWWRPALIISLAIIGFDQLTKYLAIKYLINDLGGPDPISIIPGFFQLYYAENRGAAFSIAYGHVGWLALVSFVASVFIIWFFTRLPKEETLGRLALSMILGGAIGNFIDRAFRGFVVDMLDVYVGKYHWPTFNIADSFICIGVGIFAVLIFKGRV